MPVSFQPSQGVSIAQCQNIATPEPGDVLKKLRSEINGAPEINEILKAHLIPQFGPFGSPPAGFIAKGNGLVHTVVDTYNRHHALVLRPDDIWLCILTQFNLFVNGEGRAEQLRSVFVAHEGKKPLEIEGEGTRYTADYGDMAKRMTQLVEENIVDPSLRTWIIPSFTTTTATDVVVASVTMMATLQTYFDYRFSLRCGIPHVTLLGEQDDWEQIVRRIEKLKEYGPETTAWYRLLKPVVTRFSRAFDTGVADSADNREFWNRVVHWQPGGSGPTFLSGWINAFCAFDNKGKWLGGNQVRTISFSMHLLEIHEVPLSVSMRTKRCWGLSYTIHHRDGHVQP